MPDSKAFPRLDGLDAGDHVLSLCDSETACRADFVAFVAGGLRRDEPVVAIVSQVLSTHLMPDMQLYDFDLDNLSAQQRFVMVDEALIKHRISEEGAFGLVSLLRLLLDGIPQSLDRLTRIFIDARVFLVEDMPIRELGRYEDHLHTLLAGRQAVLFCQYQRTMFTPEVLLHILNRHPSIVIGAKHHANPYYVPADIEDYGAQLLESRLAAILDHGDGIQSDDDMQSLLDVLHRRNVQLRTAAEVSRAVSRILDPRNLIQRTVELVRESFGFYYVGVFLVDAERRFAVLQAGTGEAGRRMLQRGYSLPLDESSMVGWTVVHGEPRIALDVGKDAVHLINPHLLETRSEMALPLISRGRNIGALTIQSSVANAFSTGDIAVLQTIADQLSVAIENARLFESAQVEIAARRAAETALLRRNQELALLNKAGRALISTLNLDQFLATVLSDVHELLRVESSSVWLVDLDTGELVCRQASGPQSEVVKGWRLQEGQGLGGWVAQHGRSVVSGDVTGDPRFFSEVSTSIGMDLHSILTVPLWVKQKVIGVLQVVAMEVNRFDAADVTLLESVAATVAMVIENTRLYEQARHDAETKSILLSEVNHRVKNNLMAIVGLLYAERRHAENSARGLYQAIIDDLIIRLQGLATVHTLLSDVEWAPLRLSDLVTQIVTSTLKTLTHGKLITVAVVPCSVHVLPDQAHNLALVVSELVTNTLRHAVREEHVTQVSVDIRKDRGFVYFEFRDDGPGFPDEVLRDECQSVGLSVIRNIVHRNLKGTVQLTNDRGAVITVIFPDEVRT
ncbi:MAG: GAF domain-containing protein [Anaerolineae bacterium]|nr:GAF domain-containing protein [Anaerolineae bacterium]